MSLLTSFTQEGSLLGAKVSARINNALNESTNKALEEYFNSSHEEGQQYERFTVSSATELNKLREQLAEQNISMNVTPYQTGQNNSYVCEIETQNVNELRGIADDYSISLGEYEPKRMEIIPQKDEYGREQGSTLIQTLVLDHLEGMSPAVRAVETFLQITKDETGYYSNRTIFGEQNADGSPKLDSGHAKVARVINGDTVIVDGAVVDRDSGLYNSVMEQYDERQKYADYVLGNNIEGSLSFGEKYDLNSIMKEGSPENLAAKSINEMRNLCEKYDKIGYENLTPDQRQRYDTASETLVNVQVALGLDSKDKVKARDLSVINEKFCELAANADYDIVNSKGGIDMAKFNELTTADFEKIGISAGSVELLKTYNSTVAVQNAVAIKQSLYDQEFAVQYQGEKHEFYNRLDDDYAHSLLCLWKVGDLKTQTDRINSDAIAHTAVAEAVSKDLLKQFGSSEDQEKVMNALRDNNMSISDLATRSDEISGILGNSIIKSQLPARGENEASNIVKSALENGQISYDQIMAGTGEVEELFKAHKDSLMATRNELIASARQLKIDHKELLETKKRLQNELKANPGNSELNAKLDEVNRKITELNNKKTDLTRQIADETRKAKEKIAEFDRQVEDVNRQLAIAQADEKNKKLVDKAKTAFNTDKVSKTSALDELKASTGLFKGLNVGNTLTQNDLLGMYNNFVTACSEVGVSVVDKWGRYDKNLFARLTAKEKAALKKRGINVESAEVQKTINTVGGNSYGYDRAALLRRAGVIAQKGVGFLIKGGDAEFREGYSDVQQLTSNVRTGVTYGTKAVKSVYKTSKTAKDAILSNYWKKHPAKHADYLKKQGEKEAKRAARRNQNYADKNAKNLKKTNKRFTKTQKKSNGLLARVSTRVQNFIANSKLLAPIRFLNRLLSGVGAVIRKILVIYFAFALKAALAACVLFTAINLVMALLSLAGGVFNIANWFAPTSYENTIAYNLYETLAKEENIQYRDMTQSFYAIRQNEDKVNFGYYSENPINYAAHIDNLEYTTRENDVTLPDIDAFIKPDDTDTTQTATNDAFVKYENGGGDEATSFWKDNEFRFYPNPFHEEGYVTATNNREYLSDASENMYTGTIDYNLTTNLNSFNLISNPLDNPSLPPENVDNGHTSNIKDIIAMVDVMYQMETDKSSDDSLGGILGKSPAQYNWKHFWDSVCTWFANVFSAIGNFFKQLFTGGDDWKIEPIKCKTVSYATVQNYAMMLFEASHQKSYYLSVQYGDYQTDSGDLIKLTNKNGAEIKLENGDQSSDKPDNPETSMEFGICTSPTTTDFRIMLDEDNDGRPEPYIPKDAENLLGDKQLLNKGYFEVDISTERNIPRHSKELGVPGGSAYDESYYNNHKNLTQSSTADKGYWCLWEDMPTENDVLSYPEFNDPALTDATLSELAGGIPYGLKGEEGKKWWDKITANAGTNEKNKAGEATQCWEQQGETDVVEIKKEIRYPNTRPLSDGWTSRWWSTFSAYQTDSAIRAAINSLGAAWTQKFANTEDGYMICGYSDVFDDAPEGKAVWYHFDKLNGGVGATVNGSYQNNSYISGYHCSSWYHSCTKTHPHEGSCNSYTTYYHTATLNESAKAVYKWADLEITTYARECKQHPFEYCGGHIGMVNNLNVFSITNEQLGLSGGYDDGTAPLALNTENSEPYSTELMEYLSDTWKSTLRNEEGEDISPLHIRYGDIQGKVIDGQKGTGETKDTEEDKKPVTPDAVNYATAYTAKATGGGVSPGVNIYQGTLASKGLNIMVDPSGTAVGNYAWVSGIGQEEAPMPYVPSGLLKCPNCGRSPTETIPDGTTKEIKCSQCGQTYTAKGKALEETSSDTSGSSSGAEDGESAPVSSTIRPSTFEKAIDQCRDIFDVDCIILKGDNVFNCKTYKDYAGWTATNMEMVANRFTLDWYENYGFDVSQELGYNNMRLSSQDIELLIYGIAVENGWVASGLKFVDSSGNVVDDPLESAKMIVTDNRLLAIKAALSNVGRGHSYFPQSSVSDMSKYNDGYNNYGKMLYNDYGYLSQVRVSEKGLQVEGFQTTSFSASSTTGSMADFCNYLRNYVSYVNGNPITTSLPEITSGATETSSPYPGSIIIHKVHDEANAISEDNYKLDTDLFGGKTVDGAVLKDFFYNEQAVMYIGSVSSSSIAAMREYYVAHFYNNGSKAGDTDDKGNTIKTPEEVMQEQEKFLESLFSKSDGSYDGFKLSILTNSDDFFNAGQELYVDFSQASAFSGVALRYKPVSSSGNDWYSYDSNNPYEYLDVADKMNSNGAGKTEKYKARGDAVFNCVYPWLSNPDDYVSYYNTNW